MTAQTAQMNWHQLLSARRPVRRADGSVEMVGDALPNPMGARNPFQTDVDRVIFSSAFRRLQNKTQVHPLSDNDHVHTRLTHTIEVASVGLSLGLAAGRMIESRLGPSSAVTAADIGWMVQAACLAHDIGNPPFGHSGEDAINDWFKNSAFSAANVRAKLNTERGLTADEFNDIQNFEGNAQGFRIITQLEMMRGEGGLQLTAATLGAFTKYPRPTGFLRDHANKHVCEKKPGFYQSERALFEAVAAECGLLERRRDSHARHPLVYLVEAADDICYSVVDLEDGFELGCVTFEEVESALAPIARHPDKYEGSGEKRTAVLRSEGWYAAKNEAEKLGFLRGKAIGNLIADAVEAFQREERDLLAGTLNKDLLGYMKLGEACKACKRLALDKIYNADHILPTEIAGFQVLHGLLEHFVGAAVDLHDAEAQNRKPKPQTQRIEKLLGGKLSSAPTLHEKIMRVMDYIAGMTDRYAVTLFRKLQGIA